MNIKYFFAGIIFWLILALFIYLLFFKFRNFFTDSKPLFHNTSQKIFVFITILILSLTSIFILPSDNLWKNTDLEKDFAEYEHITEAFLSGQLHFLYEPNPELKTLDNPYDYQERTQKNIKYRWDHAYYNDKYYMYYGVVPVFLLFMPFRLITGGPLYSFFATQIFAIFSIIGIFMLFHLLARLFFKKMPFGLYYFLALVSSIIVTGYSIKYPALYCVPIMAGVCLEIWSIYCFIAALWTEQISFKKQTILLILGAICGALVFGCRPPIALANLLLIPFFIRYCKLQSSKPIKKIILQVVLTALPYLIIGVALMLYNYARFHDPFEFGQTYQLTLADQSNYNQLSLISRQRFINIANGITHSLFQPPTLSLTFPFLNYAGAFFNYPIFIVILLDLSHKKIWQFIRSKQFLGVTICLIIAIFITIAADVVWSPFLTERYHLDIYYLLCLLSFVIIGAWHQVASTSTKRTLYYAIIFLSIISLITSGLLFLSVYDASWSYDHPQVLEKIEKVLRLGF